MFYEDMNMNYSEGTKFKVKNMFHYTRFDLIIHSFIVGKFQLLN
jgi:hypothetical protein